MGGIFLTLEIVFIWFSIVKPARTGAPVQPVGLAILGMMTAGLVWGLIRTRDLGRVRLGEDGVRPNRRGHSAFVA